MAHDLTNTQQGALLWLDIQGQEFGGVFTKDKMHVICRGEKDKYSPSTWNTLIAGAYISCENKYRLLITFKGREALREIRAKAKADPVGSKQRPEGIFARNQPKERMPPHE